MTTVTLMKLTKRFLTLALLANLSLGPTLLSGTAMAAAKDKNEKKDKSLKHDKLASNLRDELGTKSGSSTVKVILQLDGKPTGQLNALLASNGVKTRSSRMTRVGFAQGGISRRRR